MKNYFITGIGTDVGKTVFSAIIVNSLKADYWKPIQSGSLHFTDTDFVKSLCDNDIKFHDEAFKLTEPLSPHAAANIDKIQIDLDKIVLPETKNKLIIEGAGGIMVPLNNDGLTVLDLVQKLKADVVVVSRHYLGSINHSLLTIEMLKSKGVKIAGVVFNGNENVETEKIILKKTSIPFLGRIDDTNEVDKKFIEKQKSNFDWTLLT